MNSLTLEELLRYKQELEDSLSEKSLNIPQALSILKKLETCNTSAENLKESKFGLYLRTLSRHQNAQIKEQGEIVFAKWKAYQLEQAKKATLKQSVVKTQNQGSSKPSSTSVAQTQPIGSSPTVLHSPTHVTPSQTPSPGLIFPSTSTTPSDMHQTPITRNEYRMNAVKRFAERMAKHTSQPMDLLTNIADEIEEAMFIASNDPTLRTGEYRSRYTNLVLHLERTPQTTLDLIEGLMSPQDFGKMTHLELAPESLKKEREKWLKEAEKDAMVGLIEVCLFCVWRKFVGGK
eukprot:MONOS_5706.1-p1 / transcript=MONOS_5706.1 / gene=MONOS_5706 / organism=Monocercomonoides_exilis_PA203 / gene_product=unspecified product / transcript_product=unspecified product / location=Mono_scaffold00169:92956-94200(+) / protein_length=289 / sequence_SO=supercontig / SO=protein_coding / is_pseudo=false